LLYGVFCCLLSFSVTLVEIAPDVLTFLDPNPAGPAANHLKRKEVGVVTGIGGRGVSWRGR